MAPKGGSANKPPIHEIDRSPDYEAFINKLTEFHEKRGTPFEPEPRIGTLYGHVHIDLFALYKAVNAKGGYDELNNAQKAWATLGTEMGIHSDDKGAGQLNYQLKHNFYRYLAAFWVGDKHGQEPPPKEILEDLSCATKHGAVLGRTRDNVKATPKKPVEEPPVKSSTPTEGTPASGSRASGRLREAPQQRIPFQPETGSSRASNRHAPAQQHNASSTNSHTHPNSHSHSHSQPQSHSHSQPQQSQSQSQVNSQTHSHFTPQHGQHHLSQGIHSGNLHPMVRGASAAFRPAPGEPALLLPEPYELRPPVQVALRPHYTPANNPIEFAKRQRRQRALILGGPDPINPTRPHIPGVGAEGPNIYTRCLQSLRSGIPAEESYALHHLVKISFERGEKYKFESFNGLAEGLIEKALEVGSLFYDMKWEISYDGNGSPDPNASILDGVYGTKDILTRIESISQDRKRVLDHMQAANFSDQLTRITESILTMRNMVLMPENAIFVAEIYPLKDLLCIILNLPSLEILVELKHLALDVAEQLTPWVNLDSNDPLYISLLAQLNSSDRGTILTALRAISRISLNLDATNRLENVPVSALQNINNWLLLNDEELMDACLDFLYQYTAVVPNIESLLKAVDTGGMVTHLVRLLAHGAKRVKEEVVIETEQKLSSSEEVAPLPEEILEILQGLDEPQRCFQWLRTLFEEDSECHITQIAIWQAYGRSFPTNSRTTLNAADFIRNVTNVFSNARAQIIRGPDDTQRFIIEGIHARTTPVHYETQEEYSQCEWVFSSGNVSRKCGSFLRGAPNMWRHIMNNHLGVSVSTDGAVENKELQLQCRWDGCSKYRKPTIVKLLDFTSHLKTHLPSPLKRGLIESADSAAKRQRKAHNIPAKTMTLTWEQTAVNSREPPRNPQQAQAPDQPAGIPLSAVLVLRNIARNVVKTESEEGLVKLAQKGSTEAGGWNEKLFRPVMTRLFEVMTENKALAEYVSSLIHLVQQ